MSDLLDVFAKAVRKALGPFNDEEQPVVVLVAGLRDEIDRLRGLLRESLDIPYMNGEDLIHLCSRIHAALAGTAGQPLPQDSGREEK